MRIGERNLGLVASAVFNSQNYKVLKNMFARYEDFPEAFRMYVLGKGKYPYKIAVKSPIGTVRPTLFHYQDMLTANEIFCREDYPASGDIKVVVDIGSNIGLSALFFLTRSADTRCYLFEPVPANLVKLEMNLKEYGSRIQINKVAVADKAGTFDFGVEESGRFGGLLVDSGKKIKVECRQVNDILEEILGKEDAIDVLKIDTEGSEVSTIRAIREPFLDKIKRIYFESDLEFRSKPTPLWESRFRMKKIGTVFHLHNKKHFG